MLDLSREARRIAQCLLADGKAGRLSVINIGNIRTRCEDDTRGMIDRNADFERLVSLTTRYVVEGAA